MGFAAALGVSGKKQRAISTFGETSWFNPIHQGTSFLLNTRQNNNNNNRRRGRTRGAPGGGNRQENGSRIDNRARNNAPQMLEKYRNMARDAQTQGDRVMTEYYLQFADHYFRIVAEGRARFEEQRRQRGDWSEDGEEGEGQDAGSGESGDAEMGGDSDQDRQSYYQDRPRREQRGERQAHDRGGQDRNGSDRSQDRNGQERPSRDNQAADDQPAARAGHDGADRVRAPRPRSRRPAGNDVDSGRSAEIDASVLPPALGLGAPAAEPAPVADAANGELAVEKPSPRPRRARRPAAEAEAS